MVLARNSISNIKDFYKENGTVDRWFEHYNKEGDNSSFENVDKKQLSTTTGLGNKLSRAPYVKTTRQPVLRRTLSKMSNSGCFF